MVNSYFSETVDYSGPHSSEFLIESSLPSCTDFRRAGPTLGFQPNIVTPTSPQPRPRTAERAAWVGTRVRVACRQLSRVDQPSGSRVRSSFSEPHIVTLNLLPTENDSSSREHSEAEFCQCTGDMYC